ncbi:flavodoxin domain-containing protein [Bradyrhizobium sp. RDM4]|uniref:flavodoxin domain-containing protein n=1 Tax=Bradyrhizobium sp. RDM4 TaxID=3378765 RepID=UPI0038FD3514
MNIVILYGTETGNTEFLAEDMAASLSAEHSVSAMSMDAASIKTLSQDALFLLFTSTYGDGELPASAKGFHALLTEARPDLSGISYAVFGLGDKAYDVTFGHGACAFDTLFGELGGKRVADRDVHDAAGRETADAHAKRWMETVLTQVRENS